MNKKNNNFKATDFDSYLQKELKNPKFKKWYDYHGKQLEIAVTINKLRQKQNITQKELAIQLHTSQSNVARLETGQQNFTISMLNKIAKALGKELKVSFR